MPEAPPATVELSAIDISDDFYPRKESDDAAVRRYRDNIDALPPIQIASLNGQYLLVDGFHRILAHKLENRTEIAAIVRTDLPTARAVLAEAIRLNATHGLQLSRKDKELLAQRLYGEYTPEQLAQLLAVAVTTIRNWTRHQRDLDTFAKELQILAAYLAGKTETESAETVGVTQKTSNNILEDLSKNGKFAVFTRILASTDTDEKTVAKQAIIRQHLGPHLLDPTLPPPGLKTFDLWTFQNNDAHYGSEGYPGRIPGQILEHLLWYYTDIFDKVYDPFAGSGTTYDVCRAMFRRCWSSDIRPYDVLKGIRAHDITTGPPDFFPKGYKMDLVFLDPPYWGQKQGEYSADATNLANLTLAEFYAALRKVVQHCVSVLRPGGVLAVIIGPTQSPAGKIDHALDVHTVCTNAGLGYENRVIVPYTTQQASGAEVAMAKEQRMLLKLYRDLLIYTKAAA